MNVRRTLCLCTALLLAACSSSTVGVGFYGDVGYYDGVEWVSRAFFVDAATGARL